MITLNNISMGFSQRTLFKDVSLSIFKNEKIGLAGPNGSGKSTLFSIIRGKTEPLEGEVQIQKGINIGYLAQETDVSTNRTVMEEMTEGDSRIRILMEEKRKLENNNLAASDRYGDVLHELEVLGVYELEYQAEKILTGLGFKEEDFHKPVSQLSGGWQMRTMLGKLLNYPFDLLLLDEPTNYLDLEATLWLKDYLASYQGSFVLISHDRVFLNDVTNYTILLEGSQMFKVKGNYEAYEIQKEVNQKTMEKRKRVVEQKRQQLERFAERFHAQPNRASAVKNKRKMIEKLENIDLDVDSRSIKGFEFSDVKSTGYVVMEARGISKSYGAKQIYSGLDYEITRGQKVCLVGPNGAGKSTFLKMIAGVLEPTAGEIKYGHQVEAGYFSQTRLDVLSPNRSAFEEVASACPDGVPQLKIRSLLGLFNFHGDDVFKPVKVLSGGEKSRVILAKLLINPPNFMLLDEPTTHLDVDGVKALTTAFQKYEGTVCFISHDLYFIREIADCIVDVNQGELKTYPGGLDYYLEKKQQKQTDIKTEKKKEKVAQKVKQEKMDFIEEVEQDDGTSGKVKQLHQQHQQAQKRLNQIKNELKNLDKEEKSLETDSYIKSRKLSESYGNVQKSKEYGQELKDIQSRLREIQSRRKELEKERDDVGRK